LDYRVILAEMQSLETVRTVPSDEWQEHEAKARFRELIDRTLKEGSQTIARGGEAVAVIVSFDEYERMKPKRKDFKEFLLAAALDGVVAKRARERSRSDALGATD
jgi:prevent-host-death family protein